LKNGEPVAPHSITQLAELMSARNTRREPVSAVDLRALKRVTEFTPEDMTVTVEAGITFGALQREIEKHRQWLPLDPPNAESVSVREVLARDLSGPRRFGYGTIREHLIGLKVVLADGRIIKSGGKVVKNVAGYDLAKLFIGARDSLGIIVEATFKLRPMPEVERFVSAQAESPAAAGTVLRGVLASDMTPTVLDLHRGVGGSGVVMVLGFAGTPQEVDWQLNAAHALGIATPANLDYETQFWSDPAPVHRVSVLPSRVAETLAERNSSPFVARAGNGVIYFRGESVERKEKLPTELMRRLKSAYDPKNILPELTV
jgi:glycolate oxidase FAD binding subunit